MKAGLSCRRQSRKQDCPDRRSPTQRHRTRSTGVPLKPDAQSVAQYETTGECGCVWIQRRVPRELSRSTSDRWPGGGSSLGIMYSRSAGENGERDLPPTANLATRTAVHRERPASAAAGKLGVSVTGLRCVRPLTAGKGSGRLTEITACKDRLARTAIAGRGHNEFQS